LMSGSDVECGSMLGLISGLEVECGEGSSETEETVGEGVVLGRGSGG
jgi:hypothetical protein